ncbi:MAG: hypothetical protein MN733_34670 [Nitrososphaera sp.]|nr:hypothetical protein [Nitrososphaera sp.]
MSMHVQILQDVPKDVDHAPLFNFLQWAREHDSCCYFASHFNLDGAGSTIVDFGLLKDEIQAHFEEDCFG